MKKYSVTLTMVAVITCMVLAFAVAVAAPWLIKWFCELRDISDKIGKMILSAYYICAVQAEAALFWLFKLLLNIRNNKMFDPVNPRYMLYIASACLAVAAVCTVYGFWYMPLWFVSAAMYFLFLIVWVVRLCFITATEMKEENDLTI